MCARDRLHESRSMQRAWLRYGYTCMCATVCTNLRLYMYMYDSTPFKCTHIFVRHARMYRVVPGPLPHVCVLHVWEQPWVEATQYTSSACTVIPPHLHSCKYMCLYMYLYMYRNPPYKCMSVHVRLLFVM